MTLTESKVGWKFKYTSIPLDNSWIFSFVNCAWLRRHFPTIAKYL
jgi:hypothetical protein